MKNRIWELDAARGLFLIGMMVIHLIFDLVDLYGVWDVTLPAWYLFFKNNFGAVFLVLSGLSATLGHHPVKRGLKVFCGGLIVSAVTVGMYLTGFAEKYIIIYFGVLHCLGVCMMLWPVFRRLPTWVLAVLGVIFWAVGIYLRGVYFDTPALIIFGFAPRWFASSDYFPLLPSLGYFLLGAVIGRTVYKDKASRFPDYAEHFRLLQWGGRNSLLIYLLHQPILAAAVAAYAYILGASL